jgi:hypothetical protein
MGFPDHKAAKTRRHKDFLAAWWFAREISVTAQSWFCAVITVHEWGRSYSFIREYSWMVCAGSNLFPDLAL